MNAAKGGGFEQSLERSFRRFLNSILSEEAYEQLRQNKTAHRR